MIDPPQDIKIVRIIFHFYPEIGGSISHTVELSRQINGKLLSQTVIAPIYEEDTKSFDDHEEYKIVRFRTDCLHRRFNIPALPFNFLLYFLNVYKYISKRENRPDVIHVHGIETLSYAFVLGKITGIPVVCMLDGTLDYLGRKRSVFESMIAIVFRPKIGLVIDDGSQALTKFKKLWGNRCVPVIHGMNLDTDTGSNVESLRKQVVEDSDARVIMYIGRIAKEKNVDKLIESFECLAKSYAQKVLLVIIGEGSEKANVQQLIKDKGLKNIKLIGPIDHDAVPSWYKVADIVVEPSMYSNMNLSTLEAMACGRPVIAFDSGRTSDMITDRVNGILVENGDIIKLAKAMEELLNDPSLAKDLGLEARNYVARERSWSKRIETELNAYHSILHR